MRRIEPGSFFEHYYVIAALGEGGMSQVFLAYDLHQARLVALKFLLGMHAQSPKAVARMRREGEIYRTLRHASILEVLDVAGARGVAVYLVLEFLRGRTLDEVIAEAGGPTAVPQAVHVLEDVGSALNLAHRNQVVHRDIKPQNIMVGPDGRSTVYDFGIARAQDDLINTQVGSILGTMTYAAPEQRVGKPTDHRADIFSLGAILYEMVTGRRVIEPGSYKEMVQAETAFLPAPSEVNPKVPEVFGAMIRRMIEDDPGARYQDLKSVLIELGLMRLKLDKKERRALFGSTAEQRLDEVQRAFRYEEIRKAEALIEELAARPPPSIGAEIFHLKSQIELQLGDPGRGLRSLEMAVEYEPSNLENLLDLALLLLRMGKVERAQEVFTQVPSWIRGNLVVRALLDLIRALPHVPLEILDGAPQGGPAARFHDVVRELHSG